MTGCAALGVQKHAAPWEQTSAALMPFSVRDLTGKDIEYIGIANVARKFSGYRLHFKPRSEPAEFIIATCGREQFMGIDFPRSREPVVNYAPAHPIEGADGLPCPLFAVSIGTRGERETAVMDINNGDRLKLRIYCNGKWVDTVGAHLCQIREGLEWGFSASEPIDYEAPERCPRLESDQTYFWRGVAQAGHCPYQIMGLRSREFFSLTLRGYASVLEIEEGGVP